MSDLVQLESGIRRGKETSIEETAPHTDPDLEAIRSRLSASEGKQYWRSLEELADTEAFQQLLHREFPSQASEWHDPVGRRKFLKLMGASLALAGVTACTRQPPEYIAPYVRQPEDVIPGRPLFFATAMEMSGVATGLLVESHLGRPTKIEGNPDHPASLGATDLWSQASVLGLYDPDRSQTVTYLGDIRAYSNFLGAIRPAVQAQASIGGTGLRILTETVCSPTLGNQMKNLLAAFPSAKWHQWDPGGRDNAREGSRLAFGQYADTLYSFDKARVVFSIDSDFLACGPASLRYAREFAAARRLEGEKKEMSRLYAVETTPGNTGAKADHRLALRPGEIEAVARAVAAKVGVQTGASAESPDTSRHSEWIDALARDLSANRGASLVIAGDYQSPAVHALAHAMNQALGNVGATVNYIEPVEANPTNQTGFAWRTGSGYGLGQG